MKKVRQALENVLGGTLLCISSIDSWLRLLLADDLNGDLDASSMQPGQLRIGPASEPTPLSSRQMVVVFLSLKRAAASRESL